MKSILVIGMGRFGYHLARKLTELGNEVMVVDSDADRINEVAPFFADAQIADCTRAAALRSFGLDGFDICYVAIGDDLATCLEITYQLKALGAKRIVAKIGSEHHEKFLLQAGADEVVYPEKEMAVKIAVRHDAKNVFDYIELTDKFAIYEVPVPTAWVGKSITALNVRRKYKVNVLAVTVDGELIPMPGPDHVFRAGERITVLGESDEMSRLTR